MSQLTPPNGRLIDKALHRRRSQRRIDHEYWAGFVTPATIDQALDRFGISALRSAMAVDPSFGTIDQEVWDLFVSTWPDTPTRIHLRFDRRALRRARGPGIRQSDLVSIAKEAARLAVISHPAPV